MGDCRVELWRGQAVKGDGHTERAGIGCRESWLLTRKIDEESRSFFLLEREEAGRSYSPCRASRQGSFLMWGGAFLAIDLIHHAGQARRGLFYAKTNN